MNRRFCCAKNVFIRYSDEYKSRYRNLRYLAIFCDIFVNADAAIFIEQGRFNGIWESGYYLW